MAVTIKDIAQKAGVSHQTVSYALNNRGRVGAETVARIRRIARELQYTPHGVARSLRAQSTRSLGVVFPCIYDNEFYADIYRGIEGVLLPSNYAILLGNSDFAVEQEARYLKLFLERRVEGIILAHGIGDPRVSQYENSELITSIIKVHKIPVIFADRQLIDIHADSVVFDHEDGAHQAVSYLIGLGHTSIGCIIGPQIISTARNALLGYQGALAEHGIAFRPELVGRYEQPTKGESTFDQFKSDGYYCARKLLQLDNRPTAFFAINDVEATNAIRAVTEEGLRVPEDIAVVGHGDDRRAAHSSVSLTTVRLDPRKMGRCVGEIFLERVQGKLEREIPKQIVLSGQLVIRESCGAKKNRSQESGVRSQ